jgi:hypothetical protein
MSSAAPKAQAVKIVEEQKEQERKGCYEKRELPSKKRKK